MKALTLEDLKNYHDTPVWVVLENTSVDPIHGWGIVDVTYECVKGLRWMLNFEDYGVWVAYPEKVEVK